MPARYRRLRFDLEEEESDGLVAALWEAGTLGLEIEECRLTAYFPEVGSERIDLPGADQRLVDSAVVEERDWLAAYRDRATPIPIGRRLLVDPREPEESAREQAGDRRLLRLPARTAFGTGSHPSTSLVLEWLEGIELTGLRVLDVGAGSGILSFAARLFGAGAVVGVEIDCEAALVASQNRALNDLWPSLVAGRVAALRPGAGFDLALVNVLPHRIADDLESIRDLLDPAARAVFSGIVAEALPPVVARLEHSGFRIEETLADGEWRAVVATVAKR